MSKSSRRAFLASAGTFLAVAAAAPLQAIGPVRVTDGGRGPVPGPGPTPGRDWMDSQPQYQTMSLYQFTPQLFQPLVGSSFQVSDSQGHRIAVRLMAVNDLRKQNPGSQTAFSLRFQQKGGTALEQGTYQFSTAPLGTFLLFVVPSNTIRSASYTAIINHI